MHCTPEFLPWNIQGSHTPQVWLLKYLIGASAASPTLMVKMSIYRGLQFRLNSSVVMKFIVSASRGNVTCMALYLSIYPGMMEGSLTSASNYTPYWYNPVGSSTAVLSTATGTGGAAYGISVNNSCSAGLSSTNPTIKSSSVLVSPCMSGLFLLSLCCYASCLLVDNAS